MNPLNPAHPISPFNPMNMENASKAANICGDVPPAIEFLLGALMLSVTICILAFTYKIVTD